MKSELFDRIRAAIVQWGEENNGQPVHDAEIAGLIARIERIQDVNAKIKSRCHSDLDACPGGVHVIYEDMTFQPEGEDDQ